MACKLLTSILIVCVAIVVVNGDSEYLKKKCGTDQSCLAAAKKCVGEPKQQQQQQQQKKSESKATADLLTVFNKCLDDNGQGSSKLKEQDCSEEGTKGKKGAHKKSADKCKKEIYHFLNTKEETISGPIRCCYVKALGSDKVNNDGTVKVDVFRAFLKERVTDPTILSNYESSFNTCLEKGKNCNFHAFKECAYDDCIKKAKTQN